jgi:hypothetical protein
VTKTLAFAALNRLQRAAHKALQANGWQFQRSRFKGEQFPWKIIRNDHECGRSQTLPDALAYALRVMLEG